MSRSIEEFVEAVATSGIVSSTVAEQLQDTIAVGKSLQTAEQMAASLVNSRHLTTYQADCFINGTEESLKFAGFLILKPIGAGGMGQVFCARHLRTGKLVALKTLLVQQQKSAIALQRFRRELGVARKLKHPQVARVLGGDSTSKPPWYAMEFVAGEDLQQHVEEHGPLELETALDYAQQAAKALEYLHAQGVIHRDIKPANLILTDGSQVKLVDLGLVRIDHEVDGETKTQPTMLTETGAILGTVDYMAPDQALDTKSVDQRADLYSLGCTLYYLMNGTPPFPRSTKLETLLAHAEDKIPPLTNARTPRERAANRLFQKLLAKQPNARVTSASELIAEVQNVRESSSRGLPWRRAATVAIPAVAVVGLLVAAISTDRANRFTASVPLTVDDQRSRDSVKSSAAAQTPEDLSQYELIVPHAGNLVAVDPVSGNYRTLIDGLPPNSYVDASPDGARVTFAQSLDEAQGLFVSNVDGSGRRLLTSGLLYLFPSWSPNGRQIAYVAESVESGASRKRKSDVWVINANGTGQRRLTDTPWKEWHATWSPDGEWVTYTSTNPDYQSFYRGILAIRADGSGETRQLIAGAVENARWHPDGNSLVFNQYRSEDDPSIQLFVESLDQRDRRQLTTQKEVNAWCRWSPRGRYLAYFHFPVAAKKWWEGSDGELHILDTQLGRTSVILERAPIDQSIARLSWVEKE